MKKFEIAKMEEENIMRSNNLITSLIVLAVLFTTMIFGSNKVFAHCDGMDGPVVMAAQKALETGNVTLS